MKITVDSLLNDRSIDASNMRQVIIDSPEQLRKGLELAKNVTVQGHFENIIVCGLGGSALPADILVSLDKIDVPVHIHRDYDLPSCTGKNSLVVCISYSGNTEETVSALEQSIQKGSKTVCIATGGKIKELCEKNTVPFVQIPSGIQPRCATGYMFSSLVAVLENSGIVAGICSEILETTRNLQEGNLIGEQEGKQLAENLFGKIPVIYAANHFKALAKIWKIKFNENSKVPAFYNYFPELNHNEMAGYTNPHKDLSVIIIKDSNEHPRISKRMELTADLLVKAGIHVERVRLREGSLVFKIFSNLLLGDWVSYYLALKNNIDPNPVKIVEDFKKLMAE